MTIENKKTALINIAYIVLIGAIAILVFKYALMWLTPFLIGIVVALALQRPVDFLAKRTHLPRALWSIALVVVTFAALVALIVFIGIQVLGQLAAIVTHWQAYLPAIQKFFTDANDNISSILRDFPYKANVEAYMQSIPNTIANSLTVTVPNKLASFTMHVVSSLPIVLVTTVVSVVACCLVTKDYYRIGSFLEKQMAPKHWKMLVDTKGLFVKKILRIVRAYLLLSCLTFVELNVGFLILGVKSSILIALLVTVCDFVPVIQTGIALLPWAAVNLISGNLWMGLGLIILYVVILVVRNALEPKVVGQQMGLPPLVTLFAMYLGLQTFGLAGLIGFPVILIIVKSLQDTGKIQIWKS